MQDMPRRSASSNRRRRRTLVLAAVLLAALAAVPGAEAASAGPASITSAFTPALIGVGSTTPTALSYTLTNPNASTALSGVSFTDTLPAGLAIDNPNGESGACGSAGVITANPGSQTISLSGGSIKAAGTCTFSVSVTAAQAGTVQDTPGAVTSSGGTGSPGAAVSLTVLPPPTLTIGAPANRAKLRYGQPARARFSCAQPQDAQGLADCSGQDENGTAIAPNGVLNTRAPGLHTLTVDATSVDGLVTEKTIQYTVLPDNRFTVGHVKVVPSGALHLTLALPGPGTVRIVATSGPTTFARRIRRVTAKRTLRLTVAPTAAGATLARVLGGGQALHLRVSVSYTPKGGITRTVTVRDVAVL